MKKANDTSDLSGNNRKKKKHIFRDFTEYWHFTRVLSEEQRNLLASCLSLSERRSLKTSFKSGGWEDLFMRNACDHTLDRIKEIYNIDLLELRLNILSGHSQLVQSSFWEYVKSCYNGVLVRYTSYIFDGIIEQEYDKEYIKLTSINK